MKRSISMILSAALLAGLLAGCNGGTGEGGKTAPGGRPSNAPMGRYVEERGPALNLARVYGFHRQEDGALAFYGREKSGGGSQNPICRYTLAEVGETPQKEDAAWLNDFLGERYNLTGVSENGSGTVYILYADEAYNTCLGRSVNGGPVEKIQVPEMVPSGGGSVSIGGAAVVSVEEPEAEGSGDAPIINVTGKTDADTPDDGEEAPSADKSQSFQVGGETLYCSGVIAREDGFLLFFGDKGVYQYDGDGVKRTEFPGYAGRSDTSVHGSTLAVPSADRKEIWTYDLNTATQTGTYSYENLDYFTNVGIDEGGIYLADTSGIYRQAPGGSVWEKLVDGGLTSLIMPNVSVVGLASDGGDGFHALLENGDAGYQIMRYKYDPNTPTNPDTELTIFSLQDNHTVRQAIGEFQRRNPNVRVNFQIAMDDDSAATVEDVIRSLNTQILNGKGPDILLLDDLPAESYIEKGVLTDLTDLTGGLLGNLMGAYAKDGKIYGVPARFTVPVMMGPKDELSGIDSLTALAERTERGAGEEVPFLRVSDNLWNEDGVGMLMDYYDACSGSILHDGAVDQKALADYFAAVMRINAAEERYAAQSQVGMITVAATSSGGGFEVINMGAYDLRSGNARFHIVELMGPAGLMSTTNNLSALENQAIDSIFGQKAYTPVAGLGILSGSGQQELARSFLELLLSPAVQDNYLYDGYPVNESSLDKLVKEAVEEGLTTMDVTSDMPTSVTERSGDMGFLALCKTLNTPVLVDRVVKEAVYAVLPDLSGGVLTPEAAAAKVAEKTELYLSE